MELFAIVNHVIVCLKMNYPSISCTVGIQHRRYNPSSDCDRSSCRAAIRIYEDSLFKRTKQVVSLSDKSLLSDKDQLARPKGGGIRSKVADSGRKKYKPKSHVYGENNRDKDG